MRFTADYNEIYAILRDDPQFADSVVIEEDGAICRVYLIAKDGSRREITGLQLTDEGKIA